MSSISTLKVAWEHYPWGTYDEYYQEGMDETLFCWKVARTNKLELLKWAREEKKCKWDEWTINAAAYKGNLEMVKYCVANECPIDKMRVHLLPNTVISRYSNTYAKKSKRLGIGVTASWAAKNGHLHILEYLVERKYDKYDTLRVECSRERPLGLFEVLARNRQSAVGRLGRTRTRTRTTTPVRVYNTSSTTTVLSQPVGDTKEELYTPHKHTHTQREREREKELKKERETQNQACKKETRNNA